MTISSADALALGGEVQCFTDSHLTNMEVILTNVHRRLLWNKFIMRVSIECHLPLHTQILIQVVGECQEKRGLPRARRT